MMLHLAALAFGAIFGFLLQRARIVRFDCQINLLRLRDMTMLKFMLSAVLVGAVALYALAAIDFIEIPNRPVVLGRILIGGVLYGIGWAILGYCPGTQLGALGEGRYDALAGMIGAVLATWLFLVKINLWVSPMIGKLWVLSNRPLDVQLNTSPWILLGALAAVCIGLFIWLEKRKL